MNYNLAKKLKDAGFPQKDDRALFESDFVCYPTLKELIEACPREKGFQEGLTLMFSDSKWKAGYSYALDWVAGIPVGEGTTPSEAAAALWISLQDNEKENE